MSQVEMLDPHEVKSEMSNLSDSFDEHRLRNLSQRNRRLSVAQVFTSRMISEIASEQLRPTVEEEDEFVEIGDDTSSPTRKYLQIWFMKVRGPQKDLKHIWSRIKHWYKRFNNKVPENPILNRHIKVMEGHFGSGIGTMFEFIRWLFLLNMGLSFLWITFVIFPMAIAYDYSAPSQKFAYTNLFDGQGPVGRSWFFYGAYLPWAGTYHMGFAYLIVILITCFGSLWIILLSIAASEEPISGSKEFNLRFAYSLILWTSWDHSVITSEATINLSKGIASAFKDHLYEQKVKERKKTRREKDPHAFFIRRFVAWSITVFLSVGGCVGIVYLEIIVRVTQPSNSADDLGFMRMYFTPAFICLINGVIPFTIRKLAMIEHYDSGQRELNITVGRIFVLRLVNLATLIVSVYYRSTRELNKEHAPESKLDFCTGTIIGQELYKLVLLDTIFQTGGGIGLYFGQYLWTQQKDEYIISSSLLALIYRESLILCGAMVCPMLPFIGGFSILEFFYVQYFIMLYTCKPPIKRWKQSRKTQFIMTFLLLSILCLIVPVSVVIGSDSINLGATMEPDVFLGPFRNAKLPTDVVGHFVNSFESKETRTFFYWLGSHTVVLPLVLMLMCFLSYQYKRFQGEHKHAHILQIELQQERADNKILAKKLYEQSRAQKAHEPDS